MHTGLLLTESRPVLLLFCFFLFVCFFVCFFYILVVCLSGRFGSLLVLASYPGHSSPMWPGYKAIIVILLNMHSRTYSGKLLIRTHWDQRLFDTQQNCCKSCTKKYFDT